MSNARTSLESGAPAGIAPADSLPVVRRAVRELLLASRSFQILPEAERRELAAAMVKVCHRAAELLREEIKSDAEYRRLSSEPAAAGRDRPTRLARAQAEFGAAAGRVAQTTRDILNAVSFPRFVTELITGVFKAMVDSSQQQMHSFVELLKNVSASTDGFADANLGPDRARAWLAQQYPASFELVEGDGDDLGWEDEQSERHSRPGPTRLVPRDGGEWPPEGALRTDLGLAENESVPRGDPETTLVPLARRVLARQRQQMLASMVLMGLQRIVIESGRIHASMRFHIDTRSALQDDRGSSFDFRNTVAAAGKFGFGPWGVSASVQNTIGYVSTQRTQKTEELNTELDLNSAVEIVFRTDHVPLEVLAGKEARDRIKVNTLNPEVELKEYLSQSGARRQASTQAEGARREKLDEALKPPATHESILPETPEPMPASESENPTSPSDQTASEMRGSSAPEAAPAEPAAGEPASETSALGTSGPGTSAALSTHPATNGNHRVLRRPDVVFVPTPIEAVEQMLRLAELKPSDTLYDLGCGDGRIVITAAQNFGCRAVGVDIDPKRVNESRENVRRSGLADRVRIRHQDLFTVDLSDADVVSLYLLPELNRKLLPQLARLKPGARIISHDFALGNVPPERVVRARIPDRKTLRTFYRWRAPLPAATPWTARRMDAPKGVPHPGPTAIETRA